MLNELTFTCDCENSSIEVLNVVTVSSENIKVLNVVTFTRENTIRHVEFVNGVQGSISIVKVPKRIIDFPTFSHRIGSLAADAHGADVESNAAHKRPDDSHASTAKAFR